MEKLQPNHSYHIYNHANGFENIFEEDENYRFFLEKYVLYISPIAETYSYCLLPNHFHLVVRIRKEEVINQIFRVYNFSKVQNFGKVINQPQITDEQIEYFISKQFSRLFSCYTQSFNKVNNRKGSLFIKNFKRQHISDREYFKSAVIYTHRNPIHHGFCLGFEDGTYTSYNEITNNTSQIIETTKLLKVFEGLKAFKDAHNTALDKFRQQLFGDIK
ncbi:MAG: hypothetical protein PHH37_02270 [Paludibacter sp.]|nr:hypothetical protein [Paludibacter sp.]